MPAVDPTTLDLTKFRNVDDIQTILLAYIAYATVFNLPASTTRTAALAQIQNFIGVFKPGI